VAMACAGVTVMSMSMCANQSCPCGHNFGDCLARIAIKGAIDISSYTRFQRTGLRWCPMPCLEHRGRSAERAVNTPSAESMRIQNNELRAGGKKRCASSLLTPPPHNNTWSLGEGAINRC
jgi:hypothetical protein